jgi:DNA-binding XRE family transcriptional regulator
MDTYSFGEWLQQRRNQLRLTQKEVGAAALCSAAMIRKIEADERQPSTELAYLLPTRYGFHQNSGDCLWRWHEGNGRWQFCRIVEGQGCRGAEEQRG